jgi:peptide/nickel transport system permease protein
LSRWREQARSIARYPSALAGASIIVILVAVSAWTLIAIPHQEAISLWRGGAQWQQLPVNARPVWVNWIRSGRLPPTLQIEADPTAVDAESFEGGRRLTIPLSIDYTWDDFPSELNLFVNARHAEHEPFVRMTWHTPDGRVIPLGGQRVRDGQRIAVSQNWDLERRLDGPVHVRLFADPRQQNSPVVLPGRYTLEVDAILFEPDADIDVSLFSYGRVHGWAGTDHQRRDLMVALLWGTPVALAFGLVAAVGTTVATLIIAAIGVWFRGWVDALIQRLTEVNMILPLLPVLVMVGTLYSTSIWLMLGLVVALGIFSANIKIYRSMLLPIRNASYIEAARSYGAGNARIILRYMMPRILPVLIPGFVILIPTFVFLEASLAVLGLGDPVLPTWGKLLHDAQSNSALYHGYYYWVLAPAVMLMLTGLGFAMLGFALDRVFNPRLRGH